jgi:hypothetical protein
MSRISNVARSVLIAAGLGLSAVASTTMPAAALQLSFGGGALLCPPGTHPGYEDKYCWPNRAPSCPAGTHLGYEDKYCWPNR